MKKIFIIIFICILTTLLFAGSPRPVFALNTVDLYYVDDNAYSPEKEITVTFCIYPGHIYDYSFPYTDDFFRTPSVYFSKQFAQASIGLAVSAFRDEGMLTEQYETYLAEAGFSDIYAFGYDQPTSPETLSGVLAHKKIDDFTLVACAPCGQGP